MLFIPLLLVKNYCHPKTCNNASTLITRKHSQNTRRKPREIKNEKGKPVHKSPTAPYILELLGVCVGCFCTTGPGRIENK